MASTYIQAATYSYTLNEIERIKDGNKVIAIQFTVKVTKDNSSIVKGRTIFGKELADVLATPSLLKDAVHDLCADGKKELDSVSIVTSQKATVQEINAIVIDPVKVGQIALTK